MASVRSTQRAPQSCITCKKRKVRCSKTIPCDVCLLRGQGHLCRREAVYVKGRLVNDPIPQPMTMDDLMLENARLRSRIADLEGVSDRATPEAASTLGQGDNLDFFLKSLDWMSMGLSPVPALQTGKFTASFLAGDEASTAYTAIRALLPPRDIVEAVLAWSHTWIWWHHCAYHVPSFMAWVDRMWDEEEVDWAGTGLLMAVLYTGLFYMDDREALDLGFTEDQIQILPSTWCRAAIQCLLRADFLSVPALASVQTIVVISGAINAFGQSALHATLSSVGIRLVQIMNLHRLVYDQEFILRESGRRAWLSLLITERLSANTRERNSLLYAGTSMPLNLTDVVEGGIAIVRAPDHPTMVSHLLAMSECAKTVHDYITHTGSTLATTDTALLAMLDRNFHHSSDLAYIPFSRLAWRTCVQHKRLVLHRPLFARSFHHPQHSAERAVCIDAALAILNERRYAHNPTFQKLWSVMINTLAAAVVLTIDYFHTSPDSPDLQDRRQQIDELINLLNRDAPQHHSAYVERATGLLLSLLAEEETFRAAARDQQPPPTVLHGQTEQRSTVWQSAEEAHTGEFDIWEWLNLEQA